MQQFLQDIIDMGGEGIILRDPLSPYQVGRSSGFLKHKVQHKIFSL
jgi:ATP-dependent DNA ligase